MNKQQKSPSHNYNVLICVDLANHSKKIIKDQLAKTPWIKDASVTILNGVEQSVIFDTFTANLIPSEESFNKSIKAPIINELENYAKELREFLPQCEVKTECLLYPSIKKATCDYIEKNNIDLVIAAIESKSSFENLFTSSFTDFVIRHGQSSVLVCK